MNFVLIRKMISHFGVLFVCGLGLVACGSDDSRLRERAQIEGEEAAKKSVEVENDNRKKLVGEKESELEHKHQFYDALVGVYRGPYPQVLSTGEGFEAKIVITKPIPYNKPENLRTLEAVQADIDNLFLEVTYSLKGSNNTVVCEFKPVRPSLKNGSMVFPSGDCSRSIKLSFGADGEEVAGKIFKAETLKVPQVIVEELVKYTGTNFTYDLKR
jgi:hypothetical protein